MVKGSKNMDLKQNILLFLEANKGNSVSGGKLAQELGVTRSAIWKGIKSLQNQGYSISAVTNKGYCLNESNDILSSGSIAPYLDEKGQQCTIHVLKTVDSTNSYAKKLAQEGAANGTVIIAEEQTAGRGRLGRSFYSPASTGIYMSILLRPKLSIEDSLLITTSTAVVVSKAIENICYLKTHIKWVNDIYSNGKKLCGILSEASVDFESGGLEYAIVGIGINVSTAQKSFPADIKPVATSIFPNRSPRPVRSALIGEIINNMMLCCENITDGKYLEEYRKRSFLVGKEIVVINNNERRNAKVIEIDDKARLVVRFENGEIKELNSGEVSVRQR